MQKRHERIFSPQLGGAIHLWCFGHWGKPVLVFPSAAGFAHEWDAQGMIDALAPLIYQGKIKLYCPESNISRSWTNKQSPMGERIENHKRYEAFIMQTLVPWIRNDCRSESIRLHTTGTSLGGFFAGLFALKYPEVFDYALCMSGRYDLTAFTQGFSNSDIYFNSPLAFVPGLEGQALQRTRQTHLTLVCGQGAWEEGCIEETIALGRLLQNKQIPNFIDIWGRDVAHDWNWWRRQVVHHLGGLYQSA